MPIDGGRPTDASVFDLRLPARIPDHLRHDAASTAATPRAGRWSAAYVDFLRSEAAAVLFRKTGVLLTADGPPRPPAATARYRNWDCVFTGGPERTFAVGTTGKRWKSTTYLLRGFGSTCAFAKKWVRRLAKQPYIAGAKPKRRYPPLHHGPKVGAVRVTSSLRS